MRYQNPSKDPELMWHPNMCDVKFEQMSEAVGFFPEDLEHGGGAGAQASVDGQVIPP